MRVRERRTTTPASPRSPCTDCAATAWDRFFLAASAGAAARATAATVRTASDIRRIGVLAWFIVSTLDWIVPAVTEALPPRMRWAETVAYGSPCRPRPAPGSDPLSPFILKLLT